MTVAAATVRRLRVAAGPHAGAVTARALVEDALNTRAGAAGPAAQRGLLVLRRLDAGNAAGPGARARVASRVEQGLRAAAARAVPPDSPGAAGADAVLFRDAVEPYRLYAAALLRGGGADLWFLRAVFGHRPGAPARPRFRALLLRAASQTGAPAFLAAVLTEAARMGSAETVLAELSPADQAAILVAFTGPAPRESTVETAAPSPNDTIIAALVARAPAALREQARDALRRTGDASATAWILAAAVLAATRPGPVSPRALMAAVRLLRQPGKIAPVPPVVRAPTEGTPTRSPTFVHDEPAPLVPGSLPAAPATLPSVQPPTPVGEDHAAIAPQRVDPPATEPTPAAPVPDHLPTRFAGAVLAVTLLDRLAGNLLNHPDAIEAEIGRATLAAMLDRAGAAPFDPARAAFAPSGLGLPLPAPVPFLIAPAIRDGLNLRPIPGHPRWRLLTCRRGLTIVGCWRGRAPGAVRSSRPRRGRPMALSQPALILGLQIAARAWARDLTGRPLRALVHRPGWIAADQTHLDVTMPAGAISLAIRRAGLDIDPGWCGWLARVVAIRYDYGEPDA